MVEDMRNRDSGNAGHGSLLGSAASNSGGPWIPGQRCERAPYKNAAGAKDRRAGMPMVTEAAYVRIVKQFIPSGGGDPGFADLPSAAGEPGCRREQMHSAHTENADPDECATRQC